MHSRRVFHYVHTPCVIIYSAERQNSDILVEHRRVHLTDESEENREDSVLLTAPLDSFSAAATSASPGLELGRKGSAFSQSLTASLGAMDMRTLILERQNKPKRFCCSAENCYARFSDNTQCMLGKLCWSSKLWLVCLL